MWYTPHMGKLLRKFSYVRALIAKHGLVGLGIKFIEKRSEPVDSEYRKNFRQYLPTEEQLHEQRESEDIFSYRPMISIVVPAYRTPEQFLRELIASVQAQSYRNWELCIADGSEPDADEVERVVAEYADERIRYRRLKENGGISRNTNEGFAMASGEYIGLLDHDDVLAPNALYEVVRTLNDVKSGERPLLVYSDEDKVPADLSYHYEPHFKPDYNEELLNHYNYICHFLVVCKSLLESAGTLDLAYDGAQDYDFALRCTELLDAKQIAHIPKVLYHWRVHETSTARFSGDKDYAYEAGKRAVQAHFDRLRKAAQTASDSTDAQRKMRMDWSDTLGISAQGHEYVDVTKKVVLPEHAYVVCVGDGIRPLNSDWEKKLLQHFVGHKGRVGMVGGRLVSGKHKAFGHILACGYTFDTEGNINPMFGGLQSFKKGYYRRAAVPQQMSGCSLDFCLIDREAMETAGGIDQTLPQPYRDMDFAFRLRKAGYQVILDAGVSAAVTGDAKKRLTVQPADTSAAERFRLHWKNYLEEGDPFYNENIRCDGRL